MAGLSPECRIWFESLSPDIKSDLAKLGEDKVQEIFNAIDLFQGDLTVSDLYRGDAEKLSRSYKKRLRPHFVNGQLGETAAPLTMAHSILKKLIPNKISSPEEEAAFFQGLQERNQQAIPRDQVLATRGEVSPDVRKDEQQHDVRETAMATGHEADQMWRDADRLQAQIREAKIAEDKREKEAAKFRRSTYAKDSLKAVPGSLGNAIGKALSDEYFELLLMLLGFGFGIYLSFVYNLWIIGIPIIVGAFLIGLRHDIHGKTIWGRLIDSVIKPSGEFMLSSIPMSVVLFIIGVIAVSSITQYTMITEFDSLQFALLALTNALLLFYLWTGVEKEEKVAPAPRQQLALPPGQERLALPPGKDPAAPIAIEGMKTLPPGEDKVAILEKKVAELQGRLEQNAIEAPKMESLPKTEMKMIASQAESLKEDARDEKREAKKLEEEVNKE